MNRKIVKIIVVLIFCSAGYLLFFTSCEVINLKKQINSNIAYLLAYTKTEVIKKKDFSSIKEGSWETQKLICGGISFYELVKVKTKSSTKKRIDVEVVWLENHENSMVKMTHYIIKTPQNTRGSIPLRKSLLLKKIIKALEKH